MIHDLVIRAGTVIDGSGVDPLTADVAIDNGRITEIGHGVGTGREIIEADGLLVTPGFVDVHTHYDAQAAWDPELSPTGWHGVTTAIMGNCGVGFAPVRDADRSFLIELMEGVEDIPAEVLDAGLPWGWETYGQYLDVLDTMPRVLDIGGMVTHAAVRLFVMGARGADHLEQATADEIEAMGIVVRDAIRDGALGFSTSRSRNHRTSDGRPISSLDCAPMELLGIAGGLAAANAGLIEIAADFIDHDVIAEFALFCALADRSGRTVTLPMTPRNDDATRHHTILGLMQTAADAGLDIRAQVPVRSVGAMIGLQNRLNPFVACPSYQEIAGLPLAQRAEALRCADRRARILAEVADRVDHRADLALTFELREPLDYEPDPSQSIASMAVRRGIGGDELAYELLSRGDGTTWLYRPANSYAHGNFDDLHDLLQSSLTVPGLGDGGAHCTMIADASNPTYMLTHWCRDRTRGPQLPLAWLVRRHTHDTAALFGLRDRGVLAPGMRADCNVIDFAKLRVRLPEMVDDFPKGGRRLVQRADGYVATVVNGQVTYRNGVATGARPGRVVRQAS
jgi:N-acyl-D-aspartate/D-glutamate deacylase